MLALPLVTLHLALPWLPLPCIAYQIHCFANTASAYTLISTCNVPWVLLYGSEAWGTTLADRRRLDVFDMRCQRRLLRVFCSIASATIASVNVPNNQLHHLSYDNAAYAGLDISTACHPPSLFEESMTSTQTSMAGRDLEAAPKLDGLIQSSTTSILLASTPPMLPRWKAFVSGLQTLELEQGS